MPEPTGTFEALALELGRALIPLKDRLADGQVKGLFAELGLTIPYATPLPPALVNALEDTIDAATQLAPLIARLEQAIADEDTAGIVSAGVAIVKNVTTLITS